MENQQLANIAVRQGIAVWAHTGLFLAVLLAVQMLGLPNLPTGVIVNAVFIFTLLFINMRHALILAFLSPIGGIFFGHLPPPMYPVLPVIICGNFVFIGSYQLLATSGRMVRCFLPAALKGLIIGVAGYLILQKFGMPDQVGWFMFPVLGIQFVTALVGLFAGEKFYQELLRVRGSSA